MELRDYQIDMIKKLRESFRAGHTRPVVQAPTGSGKTIAAAAIVQMARDKGKRVMFCVPAISLIDQTVDKFFRNGIYDVGVIQANHHMTDFRQPVQVCSVQTLARRTIPMSDIVIVDEAHICFKLFDEWFNRPEWLKVPFVGLTATPWAKGMGKLWDDLVIGTTTEELIQRGHLSDFKVFAPAHPDLSGVKTVRGDYDVNQLGDTMNQSQLVADIVSTWLEKGENRPTLCFAVDRLHAKHIQQQFEAAGVRTGYVDAFTSLEDRKFVEKQFTDGDMQIVCNVGVLTTGIDWDVRCIILARPTRSEILYTQIIGRGLRPAPGKDLCLVLDHSDTTSRLGFITDIHHDALDDGTKPLANAVPREKLPKECPKCAFLRPPKVTKCPSCGFVPEPKSQIFTAEGELSELTRDKQVKKTEYNVHDKQRFYSELLLYAHQRGYKEGYAYWAYRDKFGVGPHNSFVKVLAREVTPATAAWIRHRNIAKAKAREKAAASMNQPGTVR